jgi:hypothetical protein
LLTLCRSLQERCNNPVTSSGPSNESCPKQLLPSLYGELKASPRPNRTNGGLDET